jgi:hypothetical protein
VTSDDDWVRSIKSAAKQADQSHVKLRDVVAKARANGVSWQLIGTALGVSRQAAQQRFKDVQ